MEKNLYIDASHPNETRVVLKSNNNIEDYEYESSKNNLIKNNIYLGKVSRIEPSLQAAFIDFGRERHGFLSFNDIQSDYYQIPKSDLENIKKEEEKLREELSKKVEEKEEENLAKGNLEIDDPLMAKRLENVGAAAIMPLAAPIGSGLGIQNKVNIGIIRNQTRLPLIIDAGLGQASDAAIAMELGCDGVLVNTAIAKANKPFEMAKAFKNAVIAGRQSFLSGRIEKKLMGSASSPSKGII